MDNPGDAKYGMTKPQIFEAFKRLKREGVKEFGIHSFLASNTVSNEYYPALAAILFNLAVELKENLGVHIGFINLSGGVESLTHRIKSQTIFLRSVKGFVKLTKRY